jgi:ubiquinone/menaquinone biosynthesis C-methylase UbiE
MQERVRRANEEYHDQAADLYEKDISMAGLFDDYNQVRLSRIMQEIRSGVPRDAFLDVGCGTGNVLKHGAAVFEDAVGVDVSLQMLRIAQARGLRVVQADALALPFPPESFGALAYFSVLHHVYDQRPLFREAHRVLDGGGILYTDWDPTARGQTPSLSARVIYQVLRALYRIPNDLRTLWKRQGHRESDSSEKVNFRSLHPATTQLYKLAEYHHPADGLGNGIDFFLMQAYLTSCGFTDIQADYHWTGRPLAALRPHTRWKVRVLLAIGYYPHPFAENIMILARKAVAAQVTP